MDEKYGGMLHISQATINFNMWIEKNNLLDIPTNNGSYTWNNREKKSFTYQNNWIDFLQRGIK